ncbi:hypothetical protein [Actinoplanes sp. URMC 104]|uniref:hypothetical protein n=1 Tax=Actinoplanes sp. URMC 104 TaxID=3423409 RepID=UPI003F1CCC15
MKLFRRDAGPGTSEHNLHVLRDEVTRLGADLGVAPDDLLAFEPRDGKPFVVVDADGLFHWRLTEGGRVLEDRTTTARRDVIAWTAGAWRTG